MLAGAAAGTAWPLSAGPALPRADRDDDLGEQHQRDDDPERQVAGEPRAQLREVDVEHHHHEQEQHRDRADVDDHQQHRDELGAEQQHQPRRVEEGDDQPQHAVHRIAREDHRDRRSDGQRREQVKGEGGDHEHPHPERGGGLPRSAGGADAPTSRDAETRSTHSRLNRRMDFRRPCFTSCRAAYRYGASAARLAAIACSHLSPLASNLALS